MKASNRPPERNSVRALDPRGFSPWSTERKATCYVWQRLNEAAQLHVNTLIQQSSTRRTPAWRFNNAVNQRVTRQGRMSFNTLKMNDGSQVWSSCSNTESSIFQTISVIMVLLPRNNSRRRLMPVMSSCCDVFRAPVTPLFLGTQHLNEQWIWNEPVFVWIERVKPMLVPWHPGLTYKWLSIWAGTELSPTGRGRLGHWPRVRDQHNMSPCLGAKTHIHLVWHTDSSHTGRGNQTLASRPGAA